MISQTIECINEIWKLIYSGAESKAYETSRSLIDSMDDRSLELWVNHFKCILTSMKDANIRANLVDLISNRIEFENSSELFDTDVGQVHTKAKVRNNSRKKKKVKKTKNKSIVKSPPIVVKSTKKYNRTVYYSNIIESKPTTSESNPVIFTKGGRVIPATGQTRKPGSHNS